MSHPLTFGQLSVIRGRHGDPTAGARIPLIVDLPDPVRPERALAGLRALQARHESLRLVFEFGPEPRQRVADEPGFPVVLEECARDDGEARAAVAAELSSRPLDLSAAPGWRAAVLVHAGNAVAVILVVDHLVADGWGTELLRKEIVVLAADPQAVLPVPGSPTALAARQHSGGHDFERSAFENYWVPFFEHPERLPAVGETRPGPRVVARHTLAVPSEAVDQLARMLGIMPAALWVTLGMTAWWTTRRSDWLAGTLMCANRVEPAHDHLLASQNQIVPLGLPVMHDLAFVDVAFDVQDAMAEAALAGCFDTDEVCRRLGLRTLIDGLDYWINVTVDRTPRPDEAGLGERPPAVVEWREVPHIAWPRYYWRITCGEYVELELAFDPRNTDRRTASRLILGWDTALDQLTADSERSLAEIAACWVVG